MASMVTVTTSYTYLLCPDCEQIIRFTNRVSPDGLVENDVDALVAGVRAHLLFGCEAVER